MNRFLLGFWLLLTLAACGGGDPVDHDVSHEPVMTDQPVQCQAVPRSCV